ncbi:ABC-transporter-regulating transcription factor like protein [Verticillium longisporum]|nr:ABC-transporter-regulating transcription factor like protein [Verticillium longisporum]
MLSDWYAHVIHRTRPAWAAINIVLAIAHRACVTSEKDFATDGEKSATYLRNAQTVVNELVTREEDLVGLQVLLGMSLLFLGTKNPKPASVLLGTTIRLAHRMGLHDQDRSNGLPEHEAVQRARIFWVAYYLDKEQKQEEIRLRAMLVECFDEDQMNRYENWRAAKLTDNVVKRI